MKKMLPLILVLVSAAAVLAGCGAKGAAVNLKAAQAWAGPIADNMWAGLNQGDYSVFSRDFDPAVKKAMSQAKFQQLRREIMSKAGPYQSAKAVKAEKVGQNTVVFYRVTFAHKSGVMFDVAFSKSGNKELVAGLHFLSNL